MPRVAVLRSKRLETMGIVGADHMAAPLRDGRVLVVGGDATSRSAVADHLHGTPHLVPFTVRSAQRKELMMYARLLVAVALPLLFIAPTSAPLTRSLRARGITSSLQKKSPSSKAERSRLS
jgi:hypothetical protein